MRMTTKLSRRATATAVVGVLALAGVACGDDVVDDDVEETVEDVTDGETATDGATTTEEMTTEESTE